MLQIKPVFNCDEQFKNKFSTSCCLLTISVGQEVHEQEKFSSTIQLVSKCFGACVILVDDTLQRHTMALEVNAHSGDELLHASLLAGNSWLDRNRTIYSQMSIPFTIVRWNRWLQHEKYSAVRSILLNEYMTNKVYKEKFEETIDQFLERYSRRNRYDYMADRRARKLCLEYLLEECTAMCLWPELGCQFEVYPGYRNAAMSATHQRFVLPLYPHLLHPVRVKFKSKGRLSPQTFEFLPKVMENRASAYLME